ncbi:hypothetical protein [Propioniciclava soli]|uniref:sunset domain-containing protein n=1 Tax=Propioniciclava soli TaxID=2775081 RepID=UPI002FCCBD8E
MRKSKLERAVGDTTHAANDLGKDALAQAQAYLKQAQDYLAPRAEDAYKSARGYADDARKKAAGYAAEAMDAARPHIDEALDRVGPAVDDAYQKVAPVIDNARGKVQYGLIPWVSSVLHDAADTTSKFELPEVPRHVVPQQRKKSVWGTIGKVALASGLLAAAAYGVKRFLAPADSGWQAHEPSSPYVPTTAQNLADDLTEVDETDAAAPLLDDSTVVTEEVTPVVADDADAEPVVTVEETTETVVDDTDAAEGDADPFVDSPHGEGSYVGTNPPEGYAIKGNERSMKFHVQGNGGYERTIADVWFNSEEAAEAAGFTKAQR